MVNIGMGFKLDAKEKTEPEKSDIDNVISNNETKNTVSTTGRVDSGIQGLDELMNGGFPKGNIVLISGTPGTFQICTIWNYCLEKSNFVLFK